MNIKKLVISLGLSFFTAFAGSLVTTPSIGAWYTTLQKPVFNPPNWIFGPVWTLLFFLMGVALYLVWNSGKSVVKVNEAIKFFIAQLVFNFLWSFSFFYLHSPKLALLDIVVLWGLILVTMMKFKKISKTAGYLLLPYILWVSFASLLNLAIVILNP